MTRDRRAAAATPRTGPRDMNTQQEAARTRRRDGAASCRSAEKSQLGGLSLSTSLSCARLTVPRSGEDAPTKLLRFQHPGPEGGRATRRGLRERWRNCSEAAELTAALLPWLHGDTTAAAVRGAAADAADRGCCSTPLHSLQRTCLDRLRFDIHDAMPRACDSLDARRLASSSAVSCGHVTDTARGGKSREDTWESEREKGKGGGGRGGGNGRAHCLVAYLPAVTLFCWPEIAAPPPLRLAWLLPAPTSSPTPGILST